MKYIAILLLTALLASCGEVTTEQKEYVQTEKSEESQTLEDSEIAEFKKKELEIDLKDSETLKITLDSDNTQIESDAIQISGQQITIKKSGNYEFSGTLSDGQIVVETEDEKDVQIILNNVEITNSQSSAIFVANAQQTIINLAEGSKNTVTDASSYNNTGEVEANAAIFSHDDLVFIGEGELIVNANYNDGITSKDKLFIDGGNIQVTAVDDGIRGKDYLLVSGGNISVVAEGDAMKADNEEKGTIFINGGKLDISAGDDGIHATVYVVINAGELNISKSFEGIEGYNITVNGGNLNVVSSDDTFNAAGGTDTSIMGQVSGLLGNNGESGSHKLTINGGNIYLDAGGDSLDSNTDAEITGGNIVIHGTSQGGSVLDFNDSFIISGGDLVALGSGQRVQTPTSESSQNTLIINFDAVQEVGTTFTIIDENNLELTSMTAKKAYKYMIYSSDTLETGKTYSYTINGKTAGEIEISGIVSALGELVSNNKK